MDGCIHQVHDYIFCMHNFSHIHLLALHVYKHTNTHRLYISINLVYLEVVQQNSESFPDAEKTMTPTWASQSTESSYAFFRSPFLRLQNVTWRCGVLSMRLTLEEMTPPLPLPRLNGMLVLLLGGRGDGSSETDEETETVAAEGNGGIAIKEDEEDVVVFAAGAR